MSALAGLTVAVAGLGPMGRGIARVFDRAGARVLVSDVSLEAAEAGLARTADEAAADQESLADVTAATLEDAVAEADLFVEAVVEDMAVKRTLLATVREHGRADLVVASNTSSLSIGEMGRAYGDPARVVGMHFFNPPTKMRLVEVVRAAGTSELVLDRAREIAEKLGKSVVTCTDSPNFVVNRVCRPLYYEAQLLVTQGVEAGVVDAVARGALGHRMGPLELLDFTGLHTHLASSETAHRELGDPRYRPIPLARSLVRNGMTGRAAGRGFYRYDVEPPRAARGRVVREAQQGRAVPVVEVHGPDAATLASPPAATGPDAARVVVYRCLRTPTAAQVEEVRAFAQQGPVVVDSSDGDWLTSLPSGAGWIRLHDRPGALFAEVVVDTEAGIEAPAFVTALLDGLGASSVVVPAALPGLVADRLAFCLANEASTVVEEGTATRDDVDLALCLAMNHPRGPFELIAAYGVDVVLAGLASLQAGLGDPRYRPAALLRRQAAGRGRRHG